VPHYRV